MSEQSLKKLFERHYGEPAGTIAPLKCVSPSYSMRVPFRGRAFALTPDEFQIKFPV